MASPHREKPRDGHKHVKCMTNQNTNVGSPTQSQSIPTVYQLPKDRVRACVQVRNALVLYV